MLSDTVEYHYSQNGSHNYVEERQQNNFRFNIGYQNPIMTGSSILLSLKMYLQTVLRWNGLTIDTFAVLIWRCLISVLLFF